MQCASGRGYWQRVLEPRNVRVRPRDVIPHAQYLQHDLALELCHLAERLGPVRHVGVHIEQHVGPVEKHRQAHLEPVCVPVQINHT